ncbi:MAG: sulfatase-like hydrolase/transferase [Phascolarctobacterium sp.]|nr:sulfatase-like hydrolase/transferase [Phascolarctobacterium sp.]
MQFFARFFENVQQDLKSFVYWCLVLTIFRLAFIYVYSGQLNGDYTDVLMALFLGLRLSLKTAGIICLLGFVFASIPNIICKRWPEKKIRLIWHILALVFFSICFMARIPYYGIFNAAFNLMLINGAHDDIKAIIATAIQEYQLLWRLPVAIVIGVFFAWIYAKVISQTKVKTFSACKHQPVIAVGTVLLLAVFCVFVRYGGAFKYAHSINWESAARLKYNLLNEAVLDDGQALYRVYATKKMLAKLTNVNFTVAELKQKIELAGGNPEAKSIDDAFIRTVKAPRLAQQPSNIVLLLGESFGQWPFLEQYKQLGLVDNMLALQKEKTAAHVTSMLAHGSGTISAVNGLLTGLPDTVLYENYQPMSMKKKYATGIGYIMQQLGYKTVFWYGGFPGWQNLKNFVMAQSFDELHCADEFGNTGGNAWGCPDEFLLQKVTEYMAKEAPDAKVFHLVLTTSNHPPYTLDVDKMGFQREAVRTKLPASISKDDKTLTELGHIWYADKTMGEFVKQAQQLKPDSLFVITGDHSERFNFAIEQDVRTLSTIPCIFYGQGINQSLFANDSYGCHMQLAGTLAELVGPSGFKYSAILESMLGDEEYVFNHRLMADKKELVKQSRDMPNDRRKAIEAKRNISAWRVLKGNEY